MPYIDQSQRNRILFSISPLGEPQDVGELNYLISEVLKRYLDLKGESYAVHCEIMGTLSCVAQEWYRRKTVVYENEKIKLNGDIF